MESRERKYPSLVQGARSECCCCRRGWFVDNTAVRIGGNYYCCSRLLHRVAVLFSETTTNHPYSYCLIKTSAPSVGPLTPPVLLVLAPSRPGTFRAPRLSRRPLVGHEQDRPLRAPGLSPARKHPRLPLLRHGDPQTTDRSREPSPRAPLLPSPQGGQPPGAGASVRLQAAARGVYGDPQVGI